MLIMIAITIGVILGYFIPIWLGIDNWDSAKSLIVFGGLGIGWAIFLIGKLLKNKGGSNEKENNKSY